MYLIVVNFVISQPMKIAFFIFSLAIGIQVATAQQYHFQTYSVQQGMGSASVNQIFQDSKGYIWFATQGGGVNRFNGKEFKNFTKSEGLPSNDVTYIAEDKKGEIWVATSEGVLHFNGRELPKQKAVKPFISDLVFCIFAAPDSKLYFATQANGVKVWDGKKIQSITTANGLPSNEVYTVTQDRKGRIWFGTEDGIAMMDKGKISTFSGHPSISDNGFFSSHTDKQGNVWFGSVMGKVIIFQPNETIIDYPLPSAQQNDLMGSIAQDSLGNIWIASDHGLLKIPTDVTLSSPQSKPTIIWGKLSFKL